MASYSSCFAASASGDELSLLLSPTFEPRRRGVATMAMLLGEDTRCRYPSKMCRNTRVRKASGALHRYCAYHRNKANANQKRWVDRQRATAVSPTASSSSFSSSSSSSAASSPTYTHTKYRWIMAAGGRPLAPKPSSEGPVKQEPMGLAETEETSAATLTDEDWNSLLSLLTPEPLEPLNQHLRLDSLVAAEEAH